MKYLSDLESIVDKADKGELRAYRVTRSDHLWRYLLRIGEIPGLYATAERLKSCLKPDKNLNFIDISENKDFRLTYKILMEKMHTIIDLGDSMGFSAIEAGFDIKIPPSLNLSQISKCIGDLDKIFNQCPLINIEGEKIEFKNVDTGSFWLEFVVVTIGTATLLSVFAKIVDKCVTIASHIITTKMQEEQYRTLGLKNDLLESLVKAHREIDKEMIRGSVNSLSNELGRNLNNEDHERTVFCFDRLSDWLSKGMEIYANIESPKEIKDLFPPQEKQQRIQSPKIQIPFSNKKNDDE